MKNSLLQFVRSPLQLLLFVLGDYDQMLLLHVASHAVHKKHLLAQKAPRLDGVPHVVAELDLVHVVVGHVPLHHLPLHH